MVIKHLIGTCIKKYIGSCIGLHANQDIQPNKLNRDLHEWGKTAGQDAPVAIARIQDAYQTGKNLDLSDLNIPPIPDPILKHLKHLKIRTTQNIPKNSRPIPPSSPAAQPPTTTNTIQSTTQTIARLTQDPETYLAIFKRVSFNQGEVQKKLLTRKQALKVTEVNNVSQTPIPSYQNDARLHQLHPSNGALRGSCMAFSARWLKLIQSNPDPAQAPARLDTMKARHGAEAALLQKIYSGFKKNYKSREQDLYELIKTEQKINQEAAHLQADSTEKTEQNAQARINTVTKAVQSFIDSEYYLEAEYEKQRQLFLQFIGLHASDKHTLSNHTASSETFSCQLFKYIKVNQGALYAFCGNSPDTGEWGHATGLFRRENSINFFDPNYGEFDIPNQEIDQFMPVFLQKFYYANSTLTTHFLTPIVENSQTQPKGLDEIYQEKLFKYQQLNTV